MGLEYDLFISRIFSQADKNSIPLSGAFELTSRCPLDCKMCYVHKKENDCEAIKQEKDTEWWMQLTEEAKNAGMFMLLLTGGEPLLRKDFEKIYLNAKKNGLLVSVNTNGLLIDDNKVRLFADNPPQKLNVTLYGASKETYHELCGNGEAYEKVTDAIVKLKESGINVRINYTVTQYNCHDAEKIYKFAKELETPVQAVTYMFPPIRAGGEADRLSPEDAARAQFNCNMINWGEEDFTKRLVAKANTVIKLGKIGSDNKTLPCRAALSSFWVTWDGKMSPCGMMTTPMTEITDFNSAWNFMKESRKKIFLPSECLECELRNYCDVCAAVSFAETGKFSKVPEYACKKAAYYKKLCNKFIKKC